MSMTGDTATRARRSITAFLSGLAFVLVSVVAASCAAPPGSGPSQQSATSGADTSAAAPSAPVSGSPSTGLPTADWPVAARPWFASRGDRFVVGHPGSPTAFALPAGEVVVDVRTHFVASFVQDLGARSTTFTVRDLASQSEVWGITLDTLTGQAVLRDDGGTELWVPSASSAALSPGHDGGIWRVRKDAPEPGTVLAPQPLPAGADRERAGYTLLLSSPSGAVVAAVLAVGPEQSVVDVIRPDGEAHRFDLPDGLNAILLADDALLLRSAERLAALALESGTLAWEIPSAQWFPGAYLREDARELVAVVVDPAAPAAMRLLRIHVGTGRMTVVREWPPRTAWPAFWPELSTDGEALFVEDPRPARYPYELDLRAYLAEISGPVTGQAVDLETGRVREVRIAIPVEDWRSP